MAIATAQPPFAYRRLSDETLAELVGDCDARALMELYERHRPVAHAVARRVLRDGDLVEDALQDALLTAWSSAHRFVRTRGDARAWFLTIVHHRAVDIVRARRRSGT